MPIDYKNYPSNWKTEIRPSILKRDCNKCKFCGLVNGLSIYRDKDGNPYEIEMTFDAMDEFGYDYFENELSNCAEIYNPIKIVLTIAHLDYDRENNDYENLAALCQRCHLNHDRKHNIEKRKRERNKNQMVLFA